MGCPENCLLSSTQFTQKANYTETIPYITVLREKTGLFRATKEVGVGNILTFGKVEENEGREMNVKQMTNEELIVSYTNSILPEGTFKVSTTQAIKIMEYKQEILQRMRE